MMSNFFIFAKKKKPMNLHTCQFRAEMLAQVQIWNKLNFLCLGNTQAAYEHRTTMQHRDWEGSPSFAIIYEQFFVSVVIH